MSIVNQFNSLNGTDVSRNYLIDLKQQAQESGVTEVATRISALLTAYPNADDFANLQVENPVVHIETLGATLPDNFEARKVGKGVHYYNGTTLLATLSDFGVIQYEKAKMPAGVRAKIRKDAAKITKDKKYQALAAPRHSGVAKDGLDECGRLQPGYRFEGSRVVKVANVSKRKPICNVIVTGKNSRIVETKKNYKTKKEAITVAKQIAEKVIIHKKDGSIENVIENLLKVKPNIVGYMLIDNISGETVASKKTLSELEKAYVNLVKSDDLGNDEIFVYEINKVAGKNKQGKRILVDWTVIEVAKKKEVIKNITKFSTFDNFLKEVEFQDDFTKYFRPLFKAKFNKIFDFKYRSMYSVQAKEFIENHIKKFNSIKTKAYSNRIELSKIHTDTKRFQNRSKLNENVVKNIVDNFNETELDDLILWNDSKAKKIFLLAGHHRLEALKRRKSKDAPYKYFKGTEAQAIEFAKVKSNANRSMETPIERSKIYRDLLSKKTKSEVEAQAKKIEGKNANYILNLSFLNPKGQVIETLEKLQDSTDKQNASLIERIADWIGQAKRNYNQLTNAHETEMFTFLMNKNDSLRVKTKADFIQKVYAVAGGFDFDKTKPLNLKRFAFKTEGEKVYDAEYSNLKGLLEGKLLEKANLIDRISNPKNKDFVSVEDTKASELASIKLVQLNQEIATYQKKLIDLSQSKGNYSKSGDNQVGLFMPFPYVNTTPLIEQIEQAPVQQLPTAPTLETNKLMQMQFDSLTMDEGWEHLMQDPAANMRIALFGPPKNGKTAGSLQFANYLTKFGNVLYNFADQGFNLSTQKLWIESGLSNNTKAHPSDTNTLEALEKEIATGKYKFVFVDMISDYIRLEKIKPEEFKAFMKRYPEVSFILIFEVTKSGVFKGDEGWMHIVDAIMEVKDFVMTNRGRYGFGERVIWEEGFKNNNPKRYEEWLKNQEEEEVSFNNQLEVV